MVPCHPIPPQKTDTFSQRHRGSTQHSPNTSDEWEVYLTLGNLIAGKSYLGEELPLTSNEVLTVKDYVFTAFATGSANNVRSGEYMAEEAS